jgi:hypothetical protein
MSVTFGLSLIKIGFFAALRTAAVTLAASFGSCPKAMPPPWTFGQLTLISRMPT